MEGEALPRSKAISANPDEIHSTRADQPVPFPLDSTSSAKPLAAVPGARPDSGRFRLHHPGRTVRLAGGQPQFRHHLRLDRLVDGAQAGFHPPRRALLVQRLPHPLPGEWLQQGGIFEKKQAGVSD